MQSFLRVQSCAFISKVQGQDNQVMMSSVLAYLCKNMPASLAGTGESKSVNMQTPKMHNIYIYLKGGFGLVCAQRLIKHDSINSQWGPLHLKLF